ncbi:synaptotagmin-1-like [Ciona intestinalis]
MGSGASKVTQPKPKVTSSNYDVTPKSSDVQDKHESDVNNMYMLKRMFKQIDPVVMKSTHGIQGKINAAVKYVSGKSVLLVKVVCAQDLMAKDLRGSASDPYIKVGIYVDGHMVDEKSTSVKRNTRDPIYNEVMMYDVTNDMMTSLKIRMSVWSDDGLGDDDVIGEHVIDVAEMDCYDVIINKWFHLHPQTDFSIGGDVTITMTYVMPQTLCVVINDVTNLHCKNQNPSLLIRAIIPGIPFVHKTTPKIPHKQGNDVMSCDWNESFEFPVARGELPSRYVVLVVCDVTEDNYLGECQIDLNNFDCDVGYSGTFRLSDMRGNAKVRSRWSSDAVSEELKQAMAAHAVYKMPQFIFTRVGDNKAISLRVPKVGTESRIRVVNGILVR